MLHNVMESRMITSILALFCVVPDARSSSKWTGKSGIGMIICMMRLANEAGINDPGDYLHQFFMDVLTFYYTNAG